MVLGIGRLLWVGAVFAGLWPAAAVAQAVVGDPTNPAKTFASNCSACHKSPQGLAKGGNVAGFLRQHYTTGSAMSSAMASYLASVGNPPPAKQASPADARRRKDKDAPARTEAAIERAEQTERAHDPHRAAAKQKTVATQPPDPRAPARSRPTAAATPAASEPDVPASAETRPAADRPAATAALNNPEAAAPGASAAAEPPAPPPAYPPPMPVFLPEDQPAFSSAPLP